MTPLAHMTAKHITGLRLRHQRLSDTAFTKPEDVVSWMGAMQAQDYPGAKWALALRMKRATDVAIESAFAAGTILRTHVMRPTWHFVRPADIGWMLALTGPRVGRRMAPYNRHFELDATVFRRSNQAIARALRGGVQLTRPELRAVLQREGINAGSIQRLAHIVMQAELDALICSGAPRGKQFTYALFDERVPAARLLSRDQALAELTRRYFTSHGPAQLQDFAWWSGLTVTDGRAGLEMVERDIARDSVDGKTYWFSPSVGRLSRRRTACLLPLYDEYLIAYKDRSAALDTSRWKRIASRDPFSAPIVVDGRVVGGWSKKITNQRIVVTLMPLMTITRNDARIIADAAHRYGKFVGGDSEVRWE